MIDKNPNERYQYLLDLVLENQATEDQIAEFEQLVLENETLRRDYASYLSERSHLQWQSRYIDGLNPASMDPSAETSVPITNPSDEIVQSSPIRNFWLNNPLVAWACTAALLLVSLGLSWNLWADHSVATLVSARDCQWASSSNSTLIGQRLSKGRMRLTNGIAVLKFDQGVEVTLEAPADFEILEWNVCRLHKGRIFSTVSPGGEGFVVKTPTAVLTDRGTVFGVQVSDSGASELKVFQGRVDVASNQNRDKKSVTTGNSVRITKDGYSNLVGEGGERPNNSDSSDTSLRQIQITTGVGAGDDAFVQPKHNSIPSFTAPPNALLLKNAGKERRWSRKTLLKFDLSLLDGSSIQTASLVLTTVPTQMGYISFLPDTKISVYGLIDESQEGWKKETVDWINAPASGKGEMDCNYEQMTKVGEFVIPQSSPVGSFTIKDQRLVDFLKTDTNGQVSFVLICDTLGKSSSSYVHGIAGHRHANSPAPTLRIGSASEKK